MMRIMSSDICINDCECRVLWLEGYLVFLKLYDWILFMK